MSSVRKFFNCISRLGSFRAALLLLAFSVAAYAYLDSPLLVDPPGLGASYRWTFDGVDERDIHAFGDWKYRRYHGGFEYTYRSLDSLYRQSYFEIDNKFVWKYGGLGAAYGFSMEWLPGDALWTSHHFRGELLGFLPESHLELAVGLAIDPGHACDSGENVEPRGALRWKPSPGLSFLGEFTPSEVDLGYALCFSFLCVESSFRIPGFAVGVGIYFSTFGWDYGGSRWFGGRDLDWSEISVQRRLEK